MAELENAVAELGRHDGVEQVLLVGRDGLLVHRHGQDGGDVDTVAALAPGVATACGALAEATDRGAFRTAAFEWSRGVGIVSSLSDDLLLVVLLRPGVGFAPLLLAIGEQRERIAGELG